MMLKAVRISFLRTVTYFSPIPGTLHIERTDVHTVHFMLIFIAIKKALSWVVLLTLSVYIIAVCGVQPAEQV